MTTPKKAGWYLARERRPNARWMCKEVIWNEHVPGPVTSGGLENYEWGARIDEIDKLNRRASARAVPPAPTSGPKYEWEPAQHIGYDENMQPLYLPAVKRRAAQPAAEPAPDDDDGFGGDARVDEFDDGPPLDLREPPPAPTVPPAEPTEPQPAAEPWPKRLAYDCIVCKAPAGQPCTREHEGSDTRPLSRDKEHTR